MTTISAHLEQRIAGAPAAWITSETGAVPAEPPQYGASIRWLLNVRSCL
jgi:hypothetical protein